MQISRRRGVFARASVFVIAMGIVFALVVTGQAQEDPTIAPSADEMRANGPASVDAEADLDDFINEVVALLGARYGDMSISYDVSGAIRAEVFVVQPTDNDHDSLTKAAGNIQVDVTPVRFSLSELKSFAHRMIDVVGNDVTQIELDPELNKLLVTKDSGGDGEPRLSRAHTDFHRVADEMSVRSASGDAVVPADAVTVTVDPSVRPKLLETRRTYPPYKAGQLIAMPVTEHLLAICMGAFVVKSARGVERALTAGHCNYEGHHLYTGSGWYERVGQVKNNLWQNRTTVRVDASVFGLTRSARARIFEYKHMSRAVTGKLKTSWFKKGRWLCKNHNLTGVTCGPIRGYVPYVNIDGTSFIDLYCVGMKNKKDDSWAKNGDSGGPIYRRTKTDSLTKTYEALAAGILSVKIPVDNQLVGCFDPIADVLKRTHTTLVVGG